MKCLSPIKVENDTFKLQRRYNSKYRYVPCGKCPACIDKLRKYWYVRLSEEANYSYNSQFITLTYNEASIPLNSLGVYTFCKRDIQLFLKRLRKSLDKLQENEFVKLHLRYFIVGEYGSEKGRPHYHGLFFNVPDNIDLFQLVYNHWNKGRVSVSPVNPARIGYIANYMYGKSSPLDSNITDETNKIPLLCSRMPGIGARYVNRVTIDWHHSDLKNFYQDGQIKYPLPPFWRDKIFDDDDKTLISIKQRIKEKEDLERQIIELHEYYQKYGVMAPDPDEMSRREFVRKFYLRTKKHKDSHKRHHFGYLTLDDY